ncbi:unnamed protein product, partial [Onchocerca flexuosa]|uniref:YD repeat-containing protein n=1 Tax=Onchocerca flexuosa TaxID=387005 RepID=A0A183H5F3_9BILA
MAHKHTCIQRRGEQINTSYVYNGEQINTSYVYNGGQTNT